MLRGGRGPVGDELGKAHHVARVGEAVRMVVDQRRHFGEQGILLGAERQPGNDAVVERLLSCAVTAVRHRMLALAMGALPKLGQAPVVGRLVTGSAIRCSAGF